MLKIAPIAEHAGLVSTLRTAREDLCGLNRSMFSSFRTELWFVPGVYNPMDALTKPAARCASTKAILREALKHGHFDIREWSFIGRIDDADKCTGRIDALGSPASEREVAGGVAGISQCFR